MELKPQTVLVAIGTKWKHLRQQMQHLIAKRRLLLDHRFVNTFHILPQAVLIMKTEVNLGGTILH